MKFFDKLLSETMNTKKNSIRRELDALQQIGDAITGAADFCYKETLSIINHSEKMTEVELYYEYLYLFRHIILREAFARLSLTQMRILHEYVAETLIPFVINSFLKTWPESAKIQLRTKFFTKIDEMEVKYSAAQKIIDANDNALITKAAKRVAEMTGNSEDLLIIRRIIHILGTAYEGMQLAALLEQAEKDIYAKNA